MNFFSKYKENKPIFINEEGKVDFTKLKYNLNDLFHNTPKFEVPLIDFDFEDNRDPLLNHQPRNNNSTLNPIYYKRSMIVYKL